MKVGTKSVLFGVHCFFIHPIMIALGWLSLFGFPFDPRLWVAFIVHDLGYIGKPNMDGEEGERHPYLGARIMGYLFGIEWYQFTLLHSRYLAKKLGMQPSRLAMADKAAIYLEPSWLYIPRAVASGEIYEYFEKALQCKPEIGGDFGVDGTRDALQMILDGGTTQDPWLWHRGVKAYMRIWVAKHKDGTPDFMTSSSRGN